MMVIVINTIIVKVSEFVYMWGSTLESNAKQQIGLQLWGRKNRGFEEKKRKKKKSSENVQKQCDVY